VRTAGVSQQAVRGVSCMHGESGAAVPTEPALGVRDWAALQSREGMHGKWGIL